MLVRANMQDLHAGHGRASCAAGGATAATIHNGNPVVRSSIAGASRADVTRCHALGAICRAGPRPEGARAVDGAASSSGAMVRGHGVNRKAGGPGERLLDRDRAGARPGAPRTWAPSLRDGA